MSTDFEEVRLEADLILYGARVALPAITDPHRHCPYDCEHPQAFILDGVQYCGRCWHKDHELTPMVPCTPEVCE